MRSISILILIIISSFIAAGQNVVLNKLAKFDTLYLNLVQTDTSDAALNKELFAQFDSIVINFNKQDKQFKIKIDSTHKANSILLTMGKIKYVTWKQNLWITGLDLAMIGANILILPYFPPIIPFYLMPYTYCKITLEGTPKILAQKAKIVVSNEGYFMKRKEQRVRLKKQFDRTCVKLFNQLNKQYKKNNSLV